MDRRDASCSVPDDRVDSNESISSTKMMEGANALASPNKARTSFSLSPCHFEVSVDAETEKKVDLDSVATALASIVFPVPGGPNNSIPRAGSRSPMNKSGRKKGYTTASLRAFFAVSSPATSSQCTSSPLTTISFRICRAAFTSIPLGNFFIISRSLGSSSPRSDKPSSPAES